MLNSSMKEVSKFCQYFKIYKQNKFHAQLTWARKKFYNLRARLQKASYLELFISIHQGLYNNRTLWNAVQNSKNACELDIVLTRTFNILTTNELVKLTMLWTTGPWFLLTFFFGEYLVSTNYWHIWVEAAENVPCTCASSKDSDQPAHLQSDQNLHLAHFG